MHKSIIKINVLKAILKLMVLALSSRTWKLSLPFLQHEKGEQTENKLLFLTSLGTMIVGQTTVSKVGEKGKSRVIQAFPKGELYKWGRTGSLTSCLASSCVIQLVMCLFKMDVFEVDAPATKSFQQAFILQ